MQKIQLELERLIQFLNAKVGEIGREMETCEEDYSKHSRLERKQEKCEKMQDKIQDVLDLMESPLGSDIIGDFPEEAEG